jgi:hypothetical protein
MPRGWLIPCWPIRTLLLTIWALTFDTAIKAITVKPRSVFQKPRMSNDLSDLLWARFSFEVILVPLFVAAVQLMS